MISLNQEEPIKSYDNVGVEKYEDLSKELKIFPFRSVKKHLASETMNMKYYVLTPKQLKALCETLAGNAHVENLILEGNHMTVEQTQMLKDMMVENTAIKYINLRECRIGEEGAKYLSDGIAASQILIELDLSYNSLGSNGLFNLVSGLCETTTLTKINLGNNNLTEESAESLEKIILGNQTIKEIDLAWNFYNTGPACKRIFNAFLNKDCITYLNLAWNGIGARAAVLPLAKYIRQSEVLQFLDLSSNRLAGPPLRRLRGAIVKNHSLITVRIGNNPCTLDEAYFVASLLLVKANDPLQFLDMENILFTKEVLSVNM